MTHFSSSINAYEQKVLSVRHYTEHLFSFSITRPHSFRFRSGEFVMIGLPDENKPLFRAYSIASSPWDDTLAFFSIKIPNGALTSRLQNIKKGDTILLKPKSTGTLVIDALIPGKRLFLLSTGTGIAPFASLIQDPETYEKFNQIIFVQTCRKKEDLIYGKELIQNISLHPLLVSYQEKIVSYFSTTQEISTYMGRITTLIENRRFFSDLGIPSFEPETDRVMICGSIEMIKDTKEILEKTGFKEGSLNNPSTFVLERAFTG